MEYDKIKQLMEDMGNSKLTSIDIDFADGTKIKMTKQNNQTTKDNYFVEKNNNTQEKIENLQGTVEENPSQKTDYPEKTKEKNNIVKSPILSKTFTNIKCLCWSWKRSKKRRHTLHNRGNETNEWNWIRL